MKLKQIIIKAKQAVNNHQIGTHISSLKSNGYDFVELREYIDGEDIKQINWTISAKMQKPYIKVFHDSKKLNIVVASMLDEGVLFGTKNTKKNTIANIVAILGFSAIKQCDLFSHHIFTKPNQSRTRKFSCSPKLFFINIIYTRDYIFIRLSVPSRRNMPFKQ